MPTIDKPFTTRTFVEALPSAPPGRRLWVRDTRKANDVPGLVLCITDKGKKAWYVNRRVNGEPQRVHLGVYPDMPPDDAQAAAKKTLADIQKGVDPNAEERKRREEAKRFREETTFAEVFNDWMETHAKRKKRTWRDDQRFFDGSKDGKTVYIPAEWKKRRLRSITTEDISKNHARVGSEEESGPIMANRLRSMLHTVFQFALDQRGWVGKNPVTGHGVGKNPEPRRERYLTSEELGRLAVVLAAHRRAVASDALLLMVHTGARKGEVLRATWQEFDLERGVWTVPASRSKSKKPLRKELSQEAHDLVIRRKAEAMEGVDWVFPANRARRGMAGDSSPEAIGPCVIPHFEWKAICKKAGIRGMRIHDLRHTYASFAVSNNVSIYTLQHLLGHSQVSTTERYAHLANTTIRQGAVDTGRQIAAAMSVPAVRLLTA